MMMDMKPVQIAAGWGRRMKWVMAVAVAGMVAAPVMPLQAETTERQRYVDSVLVLLRLHSDTIRQLATKKFKYSHNLARHTTALTHAFGLLGPMDWHTAEAATMQKKAGDKPLLGVEEFEKMAEHCQKSMKTLQQAAVTRVEGGSGPEPVLKALDEVQSKCNDCHSHLEGIAPDVWGTGYK